MTVRILVGDALAQLKTLPDESVQSCVTSPPYYGLRDYGHAGQIGLERTPDEYIAAMVAVMREVKRVLRSDGTLWLNMGDSYANDGKWGGHTGGKHVRALHGSPIGRNKRYTGFKPKDLMGIPWMLAFALRADGWYLRSDIIWAKPNPMPESVTDRPTKAHEYVFLLSRSERYFYDADAICEPVTQSSIERVSQPTLDQQEGSARVPGKTNGNMKAVLKRSGNKERKYGDAVGAPAGSRSHQGRSVPWEGSTRNKRTVWEITTQPFSEAHFATMPPELAETCIKAGTGPGNMVLDPFGGAGTTGLVADRLGREAVLIELKPEYAALAEKRLRGDAGMFADVEVA